MSKLDNVKSFSAGLDKVQVNRGMTPKNKDNPFPFGEAVEPILEQNENDDPQEDEKKKDHLKDDNNEK